VDLDRDSRVELVPGGTAETSKDNQYSDVPAAPPGTTSLYPDFGLRPGQTLIDRDPQDTP
jgi:hypothetical protein